MDYTSIDEFSVSHDTRPSVPIIPSTAGEVFKARAKQIWNRGSTDSIRRMIENKIVEEENEKQYTKKEVLEAHSDSSVGKNMGDNETIRNSHLQLFMKREEEQRELQRVIDNGNPNDMTTKLAGVAGYGVTIFDPTDALATIALGFAGRAALGAKVAAGFTPKLAQSIAEGVAINVGSEAAFVIPATIAEKRDVVISENITNALVGGIAFPVVFAGTGKLLSKTIGFMKNGLEKIKLVTTVVEAVDDQLSRGLIPDPDDLIKFQARKKILSELEGVDADLKTQNGIRSNKARIKSKVQKKKIALEEKKSSLEKQLEEYKDVADPVELRKKHNAEDRKIGYNREAAEEFKSYEHVETDHLDQAIVDYDNNMKYVDELEKVGDMDVMMKVEVESARKLKNKATILDEAFEELIPCVGGAV